MVQLHNSVKNVLQEFVLARFVSSVFAFVRFCIFLGIVWGVATFVLFWQLTRPQTIYSYITPDDIGREYQEIVLTTIEGLSLHSWYLPAANQKALIFLHGYPAEKSNLLPFAVDLDDYSVLFLDFRSFGSSQGSFTSLGAREIHDVSAALDFLSDKGYSQIGIFGYSFGGSVALKTAALDPRVSAVASYAAPADFLLLGKQQYRFLGPLTQPFINSVLFWAQLLYGVTLEELQPAHYAHQVRVPVLIAHSSQDITVPIQHAQIWLQELQHTNLVSKIYDSGSHVFTDPFFSKELAAFFDDSL